MQPIRKTPTAREKPQQAEQKHAVSKKYFVWRFSTEAHTNPCSLLPARFSSIKKIDMAIVGERHDDSSASKSMNASHLVMTPDDQPISALVRAARFPGQRALAW